MRDEPLLPDQVPGLVMHTEVAALLPCRDVKMDGGLISDSGSDVSYNSIRKQTDEGLKETFIEPEIIRTVLKLTKPGMFKDNKPEAAEFKSFPRSHIRDKSSTSFSRSLAIQNSRTNSSSAICLSKQWFENRNYYLHLNKTVQN